MHHLGMHSAEMIVAVDDSIVEDKKFSICRRSHSLGLFNDYF